MAPFNYIQSTVFLNRQSPAIIFYQMCSYQHSVKIYLRAYITNSFEKVIAKLNMC